MNEAVGGAHDAGAANGLLHDGGIAVVEQRHEQRAESRIVDMGERGRRFRAAGGGGIADVGDELPQRRLCRDRHRRAVPNWRA